MPPFANTYSILPPCARTALSCYFALILVYYPSHSPEFLWKWARSTSAPLLHPLAISSCLGALAIILSIRREPVLVVFFFFILGSNPGNGSCKCDFIQL